MKTIIFSPHLEDEILGRFSSINGEKLYILKTKTKF